MPLSERAIETAIERLKNSPGTFQRLVERYAYLTYSHRFKAVIPQGRNSSDVTVKGWPDAYSLSPNLLLDVVEVTHSPAWPTHLEEDLEKAEALGRGQLSGFLFAAWANEPPLLTGDNQKNPQYDKLLSYRKRLVALDIPPENVNFVFKKQLVRDLSQPRFSNVVTEILELPSNCIPFRTISGNREIFGTSGRYDVFAPSKEDYENRLVHRAAITDEVEKRLNSVGWAWLRGRGAAGKTVLAIHLGLSNESRSLPAYYLDLSKTDASVSDALNVITTHADDGVLFILDNVHINQAFARDCFDHWKSVAPGSHLLLIGRDTTTIDLRGTALPLDDLRSEAQILEVTQEDLEGVFLRLARRARESSASIPRPPQDAIQRWHRLFGGDLIAFSAAVAHRLKAIGQYDWTIQAQDATKYVQLAYLGKASEGERLNLLRLAVLAQLELDVPEEALELAKVEPFLQNGLVHSVGRGRDNRYAYYRLVHPGLGDLLLTAAFQSDEQLKRFISEQHVFVAQQSPYSGAYIAGRLESTARLQEAASILKGVVESKNGLERILISSGIQFFRGNSERLTRLGVLSESEIQNRVAAISPTFHESALNASLHVLPTFLEYAEAKLPGLYTSVATVLEQPESAKRLSENALQTPLGELTFFLGYAERKLPKLYVSLVTVLEEPESLVALTELALRTPLHFLPAFFEFARGKLPTLHTWVVTALEQWESAKRLIDGALETPLSHLTFFLDYAERKQVKLYTSLVAVLDGSESANVLGENSLWASLGDLASFLKYAERKLPKLYTSLLPLLEQPESVGGSLEAALRAPLRVLPTFLDYAQRKLPNLYSSLATLLEQPESAKRFSGKVLQTSLADLVVFLEYAERKQPKLYASLVAVLEQPESALLLGESALRTSPGILPQCLEYAEGKLPKLYTSLVTLLEKPESAKRLRESVLQTPLRELSFLIEYAEGKLPKLYTSLMTLLEQPQSVKRFSESVLRTSLGNLANCLQFTERKLPNLYTSLMTVLEQPGSAERLSESAMQTPIGDLTFFLEYAERKLPNLYTSLVTGLERLESAEEFAQLALRTPLDQLAFFLEYAERKLPNLYTSLVAVLEQLESADEFAKLALRTSLNQLAFFLEYAERKLPKLRISLLAVLEQVESAQRLSESALETALDDLAFFLEYADAKLPIISGAITKKLTDPANINFLADTTCHTPLDALVYFLQTVTFGSTVVHAIDKDKWDKVRLQYMSEQLHSFPAAAKTFQLLGRPELGEAPAINLIRVAEQQQWNSNAIGLHHLSYVLRLGRAAGEDIIHNFITSIVTLSWLKEKYYNAPTYGIAAALFSMWGYYEDAVLSHFNTGALRSRVRYELNYLGRMIPQDLVGALQLLGASAIIGTRVGTIDITWPNVDSVNEAIRLATPASEATVINHVAIQVWLGLRVMAGIRADQIHVPASLGDVVLVSWKNSTGYTEKQNALNKSMIHWLERCAESGWMLITDRQRV